MKTDITIIISLFLLATSVYGDYEHPVEREDDPKIVSRDVKCLGK